MPYSFIYFDLDDTILDHYHAQQKAMEDVYKKFGFEEYITFADLNDTYHEINKVLWEKYGNGQISREHLQQHRIEDTLIALEIKSHKWPEVGQYYMNAYRNHWIWIEGARQILDHLKGEIPIGFLTNGFKETQVLKFEQFGLSDYTDIFIISEDVGVMKPQPQIFAHATERAGVEPDQILYVGDSLTSDVAGGTRFGWDVAWYDRFQTGKEIDEAVFIYRKSAQFLEWLKGLSEA